MRTLTGICFSLLLMVGLEAAQDTMSDSGMNQDQNGETAWRQTTVEGVVRNVDQENQEVTIEGTDGYLYTFAVDQSLDLGQVSVGDTVMASFFQSIAMELREPTEEEIQNPLQITEGAATAPPGTNPGAGGLAQIKAVVTVEKIDQSAQTLTVKGPQGYYYDIYVPDGSKLEDVSKGDTIVVIYTEALAVSLQRGGDVEP